MDDFDVHNSAVEARYLSLRQQTAADWAWNSVVPQYLSCTTTISEHRISFLRDISVVKSL
jgi:hypothetical protein